MNTYIVSIGPLEAEAESPEHAARIMESRLRHPLSNLGPFTVTDTKNRVTVKIEEEELEISS